MRNFAILCLLLATFTVGGIVVSAQESEERVVDEVVAQVNDGVITLSRVNREMKNIVESEVQQGKDRAATQKLVQEKDDRELMFRSSRLQVFFVKYR